MLIGNRALLTAWVRRRYAVYQLPDPEGSALNEQVAAVEREMNTLADACFQEVQARDPAQRPLVAQLRGELRAEIEGAKQTSVARVFQLGAAGQAGFIGGFLAARRLRHLPDIGRDLANVYHRFCSFKSQDEYFQYVSMFGVTYEVFHELVFLFSEWRGHFLEPGPNTLAQLEAVLPGEDDLTYGVSEPSAGAAQFAAAPDLASRFPFHATLTAGERQRVLAAHAALLALRCQLEVARQELAAPTPSRARVVGAFRRLQPYAQHVTDLGYTVAGATVDPRAKTRRTRPGTVADCWCAPNSRPARNRPRPRCVPIRCPTTLRRARRRSRRPTRRPDG